MEGEPKKEAINNSQEKVGPTAWGIAYRRANCDIPFAKDILDELVKVMTPEEKEKMESLVSEKDQALTPQFEARYKLLNRLLKQENVSQVLELAAGVAPRGLEMTEDSAVTYVEVDLPGTSQQKKTILDALVPQGTPPRPHFFLEQGDALSQADLERATVHFSAQKPLAVVHEGLMRYLNFEQKAQVAKNIKALLETYGGVYITPDITLKVFIDERVQKIFSNMIGMDANANAFENVEAAEKFFGDLGFTVEQHPFAEIKDELVSPQKLRLSEEQVQNAIGAPVFFVMRLK